MTDAPIATRVLVLQHPREQDHLLGTVPLLEREIGAVRRVGLSWPNLAAALGTEPTGRWAVLWPLQLSRVARYAGGPVEGIVALDGTWSQTKALWWRNPWLLKLERLVVEPTQPSIYGRLRRAPRRTFVSTLEAVADALVTVGEPDEVRTRLRRAMRTMVQRVRDAGPAVPVPES